MHRIKTEHYTRISKAAARKAYAAGDTVYFCPVNWDPDSPWGLAWYPVNNDIPFGKLVTEYEYYNCNSETGRYAAFYIKEGE